MGQLSGKQAMGLPLTLRVMAATPNRVVPGLLEQALGSHDRAVRVGASKAMAARSDRESHDQLLLALPGCAQDVQLATHDPQIASLLRRAVNAALAGQEPILCQRACRYAVDADDYLVLPAIVEAVLKPGQANVVSLAAAALRLSNTLAQLADAPADRRPRVSGDPAFARRAALKTLAIAVDRFGEHRRLELLDAFLMLTTPDNAILERILLDTSHAAHEPIFTALERSPGLGAMDVLVHAMENIETAQRLLELAAKRSDVRYLSRLFSKIGAEPGVRAIQNAKRLQSFGWTSRSRQENLLRLSGEQQASAMRLVSAADTSTELRVDLAELLLHRGEEAARVAACAALRKMQNPKIGELLATALNDESPKVVAAVAVQLRRHQHPEALMQLVSLLSHPAAEVIQAAQESLGEFSLDIYSDIYRKMSPEERSRAGRLVGLADPRAIDAVTADLRAAAVNRRLEALDLIEEMGIVDRVVDQVIEALKDRDTGVRSEAARVLASSEQPQVVEALGSALSDRHAGVRAAAEASLRQLAPLDVVEGLLKSISKIDEGGDH